MEILLQGLYKASQDENEQVVKEVITIKLMWMKYLHYSMSKTIQVHVFVNIHLCVLYWFGSDYYKSQPGRGQDMTQVWVEGRSARFKP